MMWGCMTWDGVGMACKMDGKMDTDLYIQILEDELQQTLEYYGKTPDDIIFQQDNDPKHTSRRAKQWFVDNGYEVMVWPAQSPDLNPLEHLWFLLKRRLGGYPEPPKGVLELWECIQAEWEKIEVGECQKLIESMPRGIVLQYWWTPYPFAVIPNMKMSSHTKTHLTPHQKENPVSFLLSSLDNCSLFLHFSFNDFIATVTCSVPKTS